MRGRRARATRSGGRHVESLGDEDPGDPGQRAPGRKMERTTVERDVPPCAYACGKETGGEPLCQFCFSRHVDRPRRGGHRLDRQRRVRGGWPACRRWRSGSAEAPSSAMVFTVTGGVRRVHVAPPEARSRRVSGLRSMTSRAGAALVALEHLPIPAVTDVSAARQRRHRQLRRRSRRRRPPRRGRSRSRRVRRPDRRSAAVRGRERHWWSALGHIRIQQFDACGRAPHRAPARRVPGRGRSARVVHVGADRSGSPAGAGRRRATAAARRRGIGARCRRFRDRSPHRGDLVAHRSAAADRDRRSPDRGRRRRRSSCSARCRAAATGRSRCVCPPAASLPIMDDLVDLGFRIDEQSLAAVTADEARYLVARSHPELLDRRGHRRASTSSASVTGGRCSRGGSRIRRPTIPTAR